MTYTPASGFHGIDSFTYTISDDHSHTATATVTVTVDQAPTVNAGADQPITLPASASLVGIVTDDGLPTPVNLTQLWTKFSGTGTVAFGSPTATSTSASFSLAGVYVLRLTANDGFVTATDDVQITVNPAPPVNRPPAITTTAPTAATVGQLYSYDVDASDPDAGDLLTFSLDIFPAGMIVNSSTGLIEWTPGRHTSRREQCHGSRTRCGRIICAADLFCAGQCAGESTTGSHFYTGHDGEGGPAL